MSFYYASPSNRICYPAWYTDEDIREANMKIARDMIREGASQEEVKHLEPKKVFF